MIFNMLIVFGKKKVGKREYNVFSVGSLKELMRLDPTSAPIMSSIDPKDIICNIGEGGACFMWIGSKWKHITKDKL